MSSTGSINGDSRSPPTHTNVLKPPPPVMFTRRIRLFDIHRNGEGMVSKVDSGEFLEVKVLWKSGIQSLPPNHEGKVKYVCHFVFTDDTRHVTGILVFGDEGLDDFNAWNVCRKLELHQTFRITEFYVESTRYDPRHPRVEVLKHNVRVRLTNSSLCVDPCEDDGNHLHYVPFKFTTFQDIDCVKFGSSIDLIGFVEKIESKSYKRNGAEIACKVVRIRSAFDEQESYKRQVMLFNDQTSLVTNVGAVYAFSSLCVGEQLRNVSLQACYKSIVFQVDRDDIPKLLPPDYQNEPFVLDLYRSDDWEDLRGFGKRRFKSSGSDGGRVVQWEDDYDLREFRRKRFRSRSGSRGGSDGELL